MSAHPHLALWAKLGKAQYPNSYHPLLFHLLDVASVARRLWDDILRPRVKEPFAAALGIAAHDCGPWVAFCVGAHDIGKASPGFQQRENAAVLVKYLAAAGFDFAVSAAPPHGTVSVPVLADWLQGAGVPRIAARRVALAVGGHHGVFAEAGWDALGDRALGNPAWSAARRDVLSCLAELLTVPLTRPPTEGQGEDQSHLMFLAGLTSVADWVGSNQAFFPPVGNGDNYTDDRMERAREYLHRADRQAEEALSRLGWTGRTDGPGGRPSFPDLFRYLGLKEVRPLQAAAERHAAGLDGPALILVESPMGEGKTEAALCLADAWERGGGQGLYVALPTMATSNGMFGRLEAFLAATYPGRKNLHLLHGQALLSEAYQRLVEQAKGQTFTAELYDEDGSPGVVLADAWFAQDRKHGLLAPFAVGTIDQALLAVLQTRHGFVRLFGLAGKTVILDEVHAYDVYMTTLLRHLLRWLAALGCPVILLSATLPRQKRQELLAAYTGLPAVPEEDRPYPRITAARPGGSPAVNVEHIPASAAKRLRLAWQGDDLPQLAFRLGQALQAGGCVAVVRNTVGLAQQTYRALKEALTPDVEVELFHARFPFGRRQQIEQAVLRRYGKEGPRPARTILVATQVVEQSLDLDFDLLVTDLAPVDLVLQRAGRLWRHNRPRPACLKEPVVWLLQPPEGADGLPNFGVSRFVYQPLVLLRSYLALRDLVEVNLPDDLEGLIEAVYAGHPSLAPPTPAWTQALADAEKAWQAEQKEHRKAARAFLIADPVAEEEILSAFNQQLEEDNPDVPKDRQAFTRLVSPTVSLVLLYEVGGKLFLRPEGGPEVKLIRRPNLDQARALLNNTVSVQHKGCFFHYVKRPSPWPDSGLLRFHRLVRLDGNGASLSGEHALTNDPELGLVFTREDEQVG